MRCRNCNCENPSQFHHCGECGAPLGVAVLKEIDEKSAIASHYIFENGATIGRGLDNAIVLSDPSVSRTHARIDFQDDKFFVEDLGSKNGVWVNETKVRRREIKDYDRLTLGSVLLLFRTLVHAEERPEPAFHTQERFLEAIQDIGQSAKSAVLSKHVLEVAAEFAINLTRAERAIILLYDEDLNLQPAVFHNLSKREVARDEFEVSRSAIEEVEATGEMLVREQMLSDPRFGSNRSIQALQLNTIICLPLKSPRGARSATNHAARPGKAAVKGVLFGVLYLDSRRPLKGLPQYRRSMLQVLADQTSLAIENVILQKEMAEQQNLKTQLRAAKEIQQRLFPPPSYSHPEFEMAFRFEAAQQVGGDYLGFIPLDDSRFLIAIGDVVGKGLPAGLVVMTLHGGLYSEISHQQDLLALIHNLDRLIYEYTQGQVFVTFFAGILDIRKRKFEYACAGHNPALLYRKQGNEWQELRASGIPLGLEPGTSRSVKSITLAAGDLMTFYTDGITEAKGKGGKQFGVEGLKTVLSTWLAAQTREQLSLTDLVQAVFERARYFTGNKPFADDTTVMAVALTEGGKEKP